MNSYGRIHNLLQGGTVDRIPVVPIFMSYAAKQAGYTYGEFQQDYRIFTESLLRLREVLHFDQLTTLSDPHRETADYGASITFVDDGVCRCDAPLLRDYADIKKLRRMSIDETERMLDRLHAVEVFHAEAGGEVSILGWVEGPLAEYCTLRTMEMAMMDTLTAPDFIHEVCAILMDNAIEWSKAQLEAGADMIGVGDAAASLISEEKYRELVLPWQRKLFDAIHEAGGKVRLHICGNINHLMTCIRDTGADVIDLDWMVDLPRAREILGPDRLLFGQFDPAAVLLHGTPELIAEHARKNIAEGGERFGLMPGCEVPVSTPEENLRAFCPTEGCLIWDALQRAAEAVPDSRAKT
jgi:MtaA/CmuA family methyltransferase